MIDFEKKQKIKAKLVEEILEIERKNLKEIKPKTDTEIQAEIYTKVNEVIDNED